MRNLKLEHNIRLTQLSFHPGPATEGECFYTVSFNSIKHFGNVPDENEALIHSASISWSSFVHDSIMLVGMVSGPFDFFFASLLQVSLISSPVQGPRKMVVS